ncbi:hypothetical protein ACFW0U_08365, partial [Streptomyces albidoflavus]
MTVVANLCLGVIGLLPFFLLSVYVSNLGRTGGAPLGWTLVVVPLTVGFGALWFLVNRGLRSLTAPAHTRSHWWLAALLTSAPPRSLPVGAPGAFKQNPAPQTVLARGWARGGVIG